MKKIGLGCLGLIIVIIVIAVAIGGSKNSGTSVNGGTPSGNNQAKACDPKPCADADGFKVSISSLSRNTPAGEFSKPEAGNHFVTMQATLTNGSSDKKSANPFDFKLRDSNGQEHDISWSSTPGCDIWQAVDLSKNAVLGPKPLCFEASGDPNSNLTVIWSPGFFSSKVEIPLQ